MTDRGWYRFLAARPELTEVNFWRPRDTRVFKAVAPGGPFFFKTHSPHIRVVGGGFFSGFAPMRVSEAWELLGQANGAASLAELRAAIGATARSSLATTQTSAVSSYATSVSSPQIWSQRRQPGFASSIMQGKTYDLAERSAAPYFAELLPLLLGVSVELDLAEPWHRPGPVFGDPRLAPYRLGQQAFKAVVLDAYHRRCAITGTHIPPVLQAAHVRPVTEGGDHRLDNGLLLRSDVHTMFDRGYLGVDHRYRLIVIPRLREDFGNGEQFYVQAGQLISLPARRADRPNRDFLEWHLDEKFKAS